MSVKENLLSVLDEIESYRSSDNVQQEVGLLAVSKTKPFDDILEAYRAGQRKFGESYAQEACAKIEQAWSIGMNDICWYFIGPVQSNKTKIIAEHFDWVLSCDRAKIITRLNDQRPYHKGKLKVCIQINISEEEQKSGVYTEDEIFELAKLINQQKNLELHGLMAIALNTDDESTLKSEFTRMKTIYEKLKQEYPTVDTLSIGMTADMKIAIECGSNLVRIGTRIFGARNYNN